MKRLLVASFCVFLTFPAWSSPKKEKITPNDNYEKASHLLLRATFGPRPGEVKELADQGPAGLSHWLETQLHPQAISDQEVDEKLKSLTSLTMTSEEIFKAYPRKDKKEKNDQKSEVENKDLDDKMSSIDRMEQNAGPKKILVELVTQKFIRATESKRELEEVLVDFWFNHFNVDFNKGQTKWLITSYERDAIRPHVFGKFFDLLKATAQSPAMLFYLDNFQSVKTGFSPKNKNLEGNKNIPKGINENYARELMELHTLGVDGGYSQNDVIEVARILTGWSYKPKQGATFMFRSVAHDSAAKKVMGITYPAGGGEEEGIKLLQFLARQPATANHIAKKLAIRFISDNPPQSAIDALAKTFLQTDGDLTAVYKRLFELPEFWAEKNRRSKVKKPFHFLASSIRALGGQVRDGGIRGLRPLDNVLGQMGESLYRCQPPTGYKETSEFWVNPGALVSRINTSLAIAHQRNPSIEINLKTWQNQLQEAKVDNTKDALHYLNHELLGGDLKNDTMDRIAQELNEEPKVLEESEAKKSDKTTTSVNLPQLVGLILGSPEFQKILGAL